MFCRRHMHSSECCLYFLPSVCVCHILTLWIRYRLKPWCVSLPNLANMSTIVTGWPLPYWSCRSEVKVQGHNRQKVISDVLYIYNSRNKALELDLVNTTEIIKFRVFWSNFKCCQKGQDEPYWFRRSKVKVRIDYSIICLFWILCIPKFA